MNGLQLSYFLSVDDHTSRFFKGIVMQDTELLPHGKSDPALYILNTDVESGRGEHWCAAFFYGNNCEFFDPFGMPPDLYGFGRILKTRNFKFQLYNDVCVQSVSSICCGHHCLFFAYYRCRSLSFLELINKYRPEDLSWNDTMAKNFVVQFGNWFKPVI